VTQAQSSREMTNPFTKMSGWTIHSIFPDLLHVLHLGVSLDICGSALVELSANDESMHRIYDEFYSFCVANKHGLQTRIKAFELLWTRPKRDYPSFKCAKGMDQRFLVAWLATQEYETANLKVCLWGLAKFLAMCDQAHIFMTEKQRKTAVTSGEVCVTAWMELAAERLARQAAEPGLRNDYKVRPKLHYFSEILHRLKNTPPGRRAMNPSIANCFACEDFVGRTARTVRKTCIRTSGLSTLRRWLLGVRLIWLKRKRVSSQQSA
jgi:hypothetical protein